MSDPASLFQLLEINCRRNPSADTVNLSVGGFLTHAQLRRQVDHIGRALQSLGVHKTDRVALVLPNGPEMAVVFLGIACHATCAPLNPAFREEEFKHYLEDLNAKVAVVSDTTGEAVESVARKLGVTVIPIDTLTGGSTKIEAESDAPGTPNRGNRNDIALVLHTSGTTSRPKQVPLSHKNLCASAGNVAKVLELTPEDRSLNVMPLFHIHGLVGVLLSSIHAGGSVYCSQGYDASTFARDLQTMQPTWYSAVPTIHQAVLSNIKKDPSVTSNHRLRFIRSSSSALAPTVMLELEKALGVPVIESYGMTEAGHQMASNPMPPAERKPGSVGLPAGPKMRVVNETGDPLAAGQTGEIVIQGRNVTVGYVNNPEANAEAFADGWFRTGDLGYQDEDGYFHIQGRIKELINRGGEKVSPRKIDEVFLKHPAVEQATSFGIPHPTLGEDLAVAAVVKADCSTSEAELRKYAFEHLAAFQVPTRVLLVDSIPTGSTGKVRRASLHKTLQNALCAHHAAPRNAVEESVVAAYEKVLGVTGFGVHSNFFSLGGDSIKATRVVALLCSEFQTDLPAHSLFLNPTAEELSVEITHRLGQDTGMLESLLDEIEAMTDDEAGKQLGE